MKRKNNRELTSTYPPTVGALLLNLHCNLQLTRICYLTMDVRIPVVHNQPSFFHSQHAEVCGLPTETSALRRSLHVRRWSAVVDIKYFTTKILLRSVDIIIVVVNITDVYYLCVV